MPETKIDPLDWPQAMRPMDSLREATLFWLPIVTCTAGASSPAASSSLVPSVRSSSALSSPSFVTRTSQLTEVPLRLHPLTSNRISSSTRTKSPTCRGLLATPAGWPGPLPASRCEALGEPAGGAAMIFLTSSSLTILVCAAPKILPVPASISRQLMATYDWRSAIEPVTTASTPTTFPTCLAVAASIRPVWSKLDLTQDFVEHRALDDFEP